MTKQLQDSATDVAVLRAENATLKQQNDFLKEIVRKGHEDQPNSENGKFTMLVIFAVGLSAAVFLYAVPWARGLLLKPKVDAQKDVVQDLYALDLPGYVSQDYAARPSGFFSWTPLPGLFLIFQSITPTLCLILAIMSFLIAAYLCLRSPITSEKFNEFQSLIWAAVVERIKRLGKSGKKE